MDREAAALAWILEHPHTRSGDFRNVNQKLVRDLNKQTTGALQAYYMGCYRQSSMCDICSIQRSGMGAQPYELPNVTIFAHHDCMPCSICNQAIAGQTTLLFYTEDTKVYAAHVSCGLDSFVPRVVSTKIDHVLKLLGCTRQGDYLLQDVHESSYNSDLENESDKDNNNEKSNNEQSDNEKPDDEEEASNDQGDQASNNDKSDDDETSDNEGSKDDETSDNEGPNDEQSDPVESKRHTINKLLDMMTGALSVTNTILNKNIKAYLKQERKPNDDTLTQICDFCGRKRPIPTQKGTYYSIDVEFHRDCMPCSICYTSIAGTYLQQTAFGQAHHDCVVKCKTDKLQNDNEYCAKIDCWQQMPWRETIKIRFFFFKKKKLFEYSFLVCYISLVDEKKNFLLKGVFVCVCLVLATKLKKKQEDMCCVYQHSRCKDCSK